MLLLVNNLHEKLITETQEGQSFGSARTICNLHSRYIKNSLIFSQSDVRNFFHLRYTVYMISPRFYVTRTFVIFTGMIWQIHGLAFSGTCCRDHLEFFQ